jgi:hypothetical protein
VFKSVTPARACRGGGDYYINGTKIEKYFSILSAIHLFIFHYFCSAPFDDSTEIEAFSLPTAVAAAFLPLSRLSHDVLAFLTDLGNFGIPSGS